VSFDVDWADVGDGLEAVAYDRAGNVARGTVFWRAARAQRWGAGTSLATPSSDAQLARRLGSGVARTQGFRVLRGKPRSRKSALFA